ncbi:concanavalin A-like lectin/glucanase domain-containing protein [Mycena metata]|uniref:Concanavalin A-like lectin/glucanase domain-containing protein n=1 Tax=Mycena metata TaxID=1033252 RepID=A0AAD7KIJ0_9AGAR|nr:concanavalin A-like lectin/glucanase domain-containing protein [Mycena metata]
MLDDEPQPVPGPPGPDALFVLLPLLIILSTLLFVLFLVLVCALLLRRRRGIMLRDSDGPVDMSREDLVDGEGGFDGLESRWLESVSDSVRNAYLRARDYQLQYLPNSLPTDITLSQFLSIQEKGVSAWSFEPDYETVNSLIVHARTEITFLPDPASSSCVQSNLPLPKLNEVYYWEVKMFDLPQSTNVAVGLATKPYPAFRLPGLNRYSIAYHSNGEKSHNYPFTASQYGSPLKEGDVLGLGYRPRTGTVFFTRNGRKLEDAFVGLSRWNLFPTIGADGPCSVHVNLGQSGFVFIEANVKKWGLAPSVGTLAPPPAYGSERGSILLDVGGRVRRADGTPQTPQNTPSPSSTMPRRSSHRSRRPKPHGGPMSSPLRTSSFNEAPMTPPPPITPIVEETPELGAPGPSTSRRYISPTDLPFHAPPNINLPSEAEEDERSPSSSPASSSRSLSPDAVAGARNPFATPRRHRPSLTHMAASLSDSGSELTIQVHAPPESPMTPNPPTPNVLDIHLQALSSSSHRRTGSGGSHSSREHDDRLAPQALVRRDPPAYSPLDAFTYQDGVHIDLPAEVIAAALEGNAMPTSAIGHGHSDRTRRTRRH